MIRKEGLMRRTSERRIGRFEHRKTIMKRRL